MKSDTVREAELDECKTNWVHFALAIIIPFAVVGIVKLFIATTFVVPTASMSPTVNPDGRVFATYMHVTPSLERGNVIVFNDVHNWTNGTGYILKRVIALPGDTIEVTSDNQLILNDKEVDEPYLSTNVLTLPFPKITIPEGYVFVMGDNRENSLDSRNLGNETQFIPIEAIHAKVLFTYWPLDQIHTF